MRSKYLASQKTALIFAFAWNKMAYTLVQPYESRSFSRTLNSFWCEASLASPLQQFYAALHLIVNDKRH